MENPHTYCGDKKPWSPRPLIYDPLYEIKVHRFIWLLEQEGHLPTLEYGMKDQVASTRTFLHWMCIVSQELPTPEYAMKDWVASTKTFLHWMCIVSQELRWQSRHFALWAINWRHESAIDIYRNGNTILLLTYIKKMIFTEKTNVAVTKIIMGK